MAEPTRTPAPLWGLASIARVAMRFALACTTLGTALVLTRPLVYAVVARIARDVALWTTPPGLVSALGWHEPLRRFVLDSLALGVSVHIDSLSLAFLLVVPGAFTWALPRAHRLRATALQLAVCLALGSAIVAQDLLAIVSRALVAHGVAPFGPGRSAFYEGWIRMGWDLAMIAVPAAVCLWALFPLLVAEPEMGASAATPRARAWALAGGLAVALALLDLGATSRLADADSEASFLRALGEREPRLPGYLLGRGLASAQRGRLADAEAFLERATLFPSTETQARAALAELPAGAR